MNIYKNARLTPLGRERIVKEVLSGQTSEAAARAAGVWRGPCACGWRASKPWALRLFAYGIAILPKSDCSLSVAMLVYWQENP